MREDDVVLISDEDIPCAIYASHGVVERNGVIPAHSLVAADGKFDKGFGVGGWVGLGSHWLVPTGTEEQAIMPDDPSVFDLVLLICRVEVGIVHPFAFGSGGYDLGPEIIAGYVGSEGALNLLSSDLLDRVSDHEVVLISDEDIPCAIYAIHRVVERNGSVPSLGVIAADGLFHKGFGICGWVRFSGPQNTGEPRQLIADQPQLVLDFTELPAHQGQLILNSTQLLLELGLLLRALICLLRADLGFIACGDYGEDEADAYDNS